jgi:hypothetical protein
MATWAQGSPSSATEQNSLYRRPAGGTWSGPALLGQIGNGTLTGRIAFVGSDAFALTQGGPTSVVQATRWRSGAAAPDAFRDLVSPGTPGLGLRGFVADLEGRLLALVSDGSTPGAVRDLGIPFDGSPPRLRGLSVPGSATTGQPVALSADFVDRWSAIAQVRWDFGDGTTGTGASPSHTWSRPGVYTVTVTGTDARGNARTGNAQITVANPGPPVSPADTIRPVVTLALPACGKRRGAVCARFRATRPAWRILKGTARDAGGSGLARVQVAVSRVQGKRTLVLRGARFRPGTAKVAARTYLPARLRNGRWTFTIPRAWPAGRYVIRARAVDRAGNISRVVTRTRVLR